MSSKKGGRRVGKVDLNSTADHGMESLRMTKNAAVRTRRAVNLPKRIARTAKNTVTAVKTVARASVVLISHTVAFLFNPVVLILMLVTAMIIFSAVLITQAAGTEQAEETQVMGGAYIGMTGIDDISARYPDAAEYYRIACQNNRSRFESLIDGMYYQYTDLEHSDLVYMELDLNGTVTKYETGFPTDAYKTMLKDAQTVPVTERQAAAIAYVYLEMQENKAHGTEMGIYDVAFTQSCFDSIVNASAVWSTASYTNQRCPSADCSSEEVPNLAYHTAKEQYDQAAERYNSWNEQVVPAASGYRMMLSTYNSAPSIVQSAIRAALNAALSALTEAVQNWEADYGRRGWPINENIGSYGLNVLSEEVSAALETMNKTPKMIKSPEAVCHLHHKLWSIGLYGYSSEAVMNSLGFNDQYKEWVALVEYGMNTNPEFGEEDDI